MYTFLAIFTSLFLAITMYRHSLPFSKDPFLQGTCISVDHAVALTSLPLVLQQGKAALHWAVERGHLQASTVLLQHRAFVNAKSKQGVSALHIAARNGFDRLVRMLIQEYNAATDIMTLVRPHLFVCLLVCLLIHFVVSLIGLFTLLFYLFVCLLCCFTYWFVHFVVHFFIFTFLFIY